MRSKMKEIINVIIDNNANVIKLIDASNNQIMHPFDHVFDNEWISIPGIGDINIYDYSEYDGEDRNDLISEFGYACIIYPIEDNYQAFYQPKLITIND